MEIIKNADEARMSYLGKQELNENATYRNMEYTTTVEVESGFLLYNNLTGELVFVSKAEKSILENIDLSHELCKKLIEKWYYVPNDNSDKQLCDNLTDFMTFLTNTKCGQAITKFTIFPTTDCNARCFYCYEKGIKKYHMTEQTATDVAEFIIKKSCGKRVKLHWFGGEPLYNSKAIDIITDILRKNSVDFISSMISNGYLFDEELIKNAVNNWNLKRVQITLDGTEEKYNVIKNYIYPGVNAFKRVISNIQNLLDSDVFVTIRMNMDSHNYENLFELVDYLLEEFGEYQNITIYSQTLFDESTDKHMLRTEDDRLKLCEMNQKLNKHIKSKMICDNNTLKGYLKNQQCMADNDGTTTITPDGHLGKCEHFSDKYFWGSIYSDEINEENILKFKKYIKLPKECESCNLRPACLHRLEICPDAPKSCNAELKKAHLFNVKNRILGTYEDWKKANNTKV